MSVEQEDQTQKATHEQAKEAASIRGPGGGVRQPQSCHWPTSYGLAVGQGELAPLDYLEGEECQTRTCFLGPNTPWAASGRKPQEDRGPTGHGSAAGRALQASSSKKNFVASLGPAISLPVQQFLAACSRAHPS